MPDLVPIPVGDLLVLREEQDRAAQDMTKSLGELRRATLLRTALDELLSRREKEAMHAASAEQTI